MRLPTFLNTVGDIVRAIAKYCLQKRWKQTFRIFTIFYVLTRLHCSRFDHNILKFCFQGFYSLERAYRLFVEGCGVRLLFLTFTFFSLSLLLCVYTHTQTHTEKSKKGPCMHFTMPNLYDNAPAVVCFCNNPQKQQLFPEQPRSRVSSLYVFYIYRGRRARKKEEEGGNATGSETAGSACCRGRESKTKKMSFCFSRKSSAAKRNGRKPSDN